MSQDSKFTRDTGVIDDDYYISELIQEKGSYHFGLLLDELSDYLVEKEQLCTFREWAIRFNGILKKTGVLSLQDRLEIINQRWNGCYILQSTCWFKRILYRTRKVHNIISFILVFLPLLATFKNNAPNKVCVLGLFLWFINFIIIHRSYDYSEKRRPRCAFLLCMLVNISVSAFFVVVFSFPFWLLQRIMWICLVFIIHQFFTWLRKHESEYDIFYHMDSEQEKERYITKSYY